MQIVESSVDMNNLPVVGNYDKRSFIFSIESKI